MPRHYTHSTTLAGASGEADARELGALVERAAGLGMTRQDLEDALARRTGFEAAVRGWFRHNEPPNGLVRRIILNGAMHHIGQVQAQRTPAPSREP